MRAALLLLALAIASPVHATCKQPILDLEAKRLLGKSENLCARYGGQVVLVVNTASKCGYTPQYEGLEALYRAHRDQGLVVLGFPSDQFMGQEYSDEKEIQKFCQANFGVSFPMFGKTEVKGDAASPLFKQLQQATGAAPGWNFNKYLIGRDGRVVAHYKSGVEPQSAELLSAVQAELAKPAPN